MQYARTLCSVHATHVISHCGNTKLKTCWTRSAHGKKRVLEWGNFLKTEQAYLSDVRHRKKTTQTNLKQMGCADET